jgi:hypothetical protein
MPTAIKRLKQVATLDPDNAQKRVVRGFASIERGRYIDIDGDQQLRAFFAGIAESGKQRSVASKLTARK